MSDDAPASAAISVGTVRIGGGDAGLTPAGLRGGLAQALGDRLAAASPGGAAAQRLPSVRVSVPAGAKASEIAEAIAAAIGRTIDRRGDKG